MWCTLLDPQLSLKTAWLYPWHLRLTKSVIQHGKALYRPVPLDLDTQSDSHICKATIIMCIPGHLHSLSGTKSRWQYLEPVTCMPWLYVTSYRLADEVHAYIQSIVLKHNALWASSLQASSWRVHTFYIELTASLWGIKSHYVADNLHVRSKNRN